MKFNFKIQQYQTDAVNAVVNVFSGQSYRKTSHYIRDLGTLEKPAVAQLSFDYENDPYDDIGFKNNALELSSEQLLENVHKIQRENNIKLSPELIKDLGRYNVPLVKTQMKKIIVTAKTLYSHPKNVSKIYAALHTDLAW